MNADLARELFRTQGYNGMEIGRSEGFKRKAPAVKYSGKVEGRTYC